MDELFQNILEASFHGSIVILVILALRLFLKKTPKNVLCLLWLLAALRLLLPFQIESPLSLQPDLDAAVQVQTEQPAENITPVPTPSAPNQVPAIPDSEPLPDDVVISVTDDAVSGDAHTVIDVKAIAARVWLTVAAGLGIYSAVSFLLLKRRVREAALVMPGVYECCGLDTAFLLGFLKPRIYLPAELSREEKAFILAHEQAHLRRGDHWWKLLGFLTLALHWFNPLVWAAYILLCRDLEMACDDAVVRSMDLSSRKAYSTALLNCCARRNFLSACPVAFGEVSVKARIKNVLDYRKPKFWITLVAVLALVFVAVCFLTTPAQPGDDDTTESPEDSTLSDSPIIPGGIVFNEEEQALLDRCKAALEKLQKQENLGVRFTSEYSGDYQIHASSINHYYRQGDEWLMYISSPVTELNSVYDGIHCEYFCTEGMLYEYSTPYYLASSSLLYPYWEELPSGSQIELPWLLTTSWPARYISAVTAQGNVITVTVESDPWEKDTSRIREYALTFHFADGSLTRIDHSYAYERLSPDAETGEIKSGACTTVMEILDAGDAAMAHDLEIARSTLEKQQQAEDPLYLMYKQTFYSTFTASDRVCLADVTHDGTPEMLVVTENAELGTVHGYVFSTFKDRICQIYSNEGRANYNSPNYSWYLRKTENGYNLAEEYLDMRQGHGYVSFTEYYLTGSGLRVDVDTIYVDSREHPDPNSSIGLIDMEAFEAYEKALNERIGNYILIFNNDTCSDGSYQLMETDPAVVFAD